MRWMFPTVAAMLMTSCMDVPTEDVLVVLERQEDGTRRTVHVRKELIRIDEANKAQPFRVQPDDVLKLVALGYPELTHVAKVQPNGRVVFPLVGEVEVVGKTPSEIESAIREKLSQTGAVAPVKLQKDDSIKMVVWRQQELTHTAAVQEDGRVVLPIVGEIQAEGRTIEQVREEVTQKLSKHLQDPIVSILPVHLLKRTVPAGAVSILVQETRPRRVAVFGEVMVPGLHPMQGNLRVLEALARAHPKDTAHINNVVVIRIQGNDRAQYMVCRLADFVGASDLTQNIFLQDGDVIIVPKTAIAKVDDFIDKFFARTKPIFDWWISAVYARYALDISRTTVDINESIRSNLKD